MAVQPPFKIPVIPSDMFSARARFEAHVERAAAAFQSASATLQVSPHLSVTTHASSPQPVAKAPSKPAPIVKSQAQLDDELYATLFGKDAR